MAFKKGDLVYFVNSDYDMSDWIDAGYVDFIYKDGSYRLDGGKNLRAKRVSASCAYATPEEAAEEMTKAFLDDIPRLIEEAKESRRLLDLRRPEK